MDQVVALRLRSLWFHSPRLCRVAVFLIQTNVSLRTTQSSLALCAFFAQQSRVIVTVEGTHVQLAIDSALQILTLTCPRGGVLRVRQLTDNTGRSDYRRLPAPSAPGGTERANHGASRFAT